MAANANQNEQEQGDRNAAFFASAKEAFQEVRNEVRDGLNAVHQPITEPLLRDGTLKAAFRQGIDELGEALKAFPSSVQREEAGTVFSPTQGEVAADRKETPMSPSQIVEAARSQERETEQPAKEAGNVYGDKEVAKSPSEMVKAARQQEAEQDLQPQNEQQRERDRSM